MNGEESNQKIFVELFLILQYVLTLMWSVFVLQMQPILLQHYFEEKKQRKMAIIYCIIL